MVLSDNTMNVLKNFAIINPSILIKPGKRLRTISPLQTIIASVEVDDEFPTTAGIDDLPRFLATMGLFSQPDLEFSEKVVTIKEQNRTVNYVLSAKIMTVPPEKDIVMPECEAVFDCSWSEISSAVKAANVLNLPEVGFFGNGNTISIGCVDPDNPTSDNYTFDIGQTDQYFKLFVKVANLRLFPNDYQVSISSKGLCLFEAPKMKFYVALEANHSSFGE